jgi:hypothetical protein
MRLGITQLFYGFREYLGRPSVRRRVAAVQLAGRAEDYLVKEFVHYVAAETGGRRFCEVNLGRRGQQRVDVVLTKVQGHKEVSEAFVEAKFVRNRHRRGGHPLGALDELGSTLGSLRAQLRLAPRRTHGSHSVALRARTAKVYGLVFASYAHRADEDDASVKFFPRILEEAHRRGLRYHDLPKPYFRTAFEDQPVAVLGHKWLVSLRLGLWRA